MSESTEDAVRSARTAEREAGHRFTFGVNEACPSALAMSQSARVAC